MAGCNGAGLAEVHVEHWLTEEVLPSGGVWQGIAVAGRLSCHLFCK
jgi:hypothetical protein